MIRLLMIEQDALYAELTLRTLRSSGLSCACERVINEEEFRKALARSPDLILDVALFRTWRISRPWQSQKRPSRPHLSFSSQGRATQLLHGAR